MTTNRVVKATRFRRLPPADRLGGPDWDSLRSPAGRGGRAPAALPPSVIALQAAPRRQYVIRADLRRYGVTVGCCACADIAAHGNPRRPRTDECRSRVEDFLQNDEAGKERLRVHRRRHSEVPEAPENDADVEAEAAGEGARHSTVEFIRLLILWFRWQQQLQ